MTKLNLKYVTEVKSDKGYTKTTIVCPQCSQTLSIRKFKEHLTKTHPFKVDEIGAQLFNLQYPVKCEKCMGLMKFDVNNFNYPTRHRMCPSKEVLNPEVKHEFNSTSEINDKMSELDDEIRRLKAEKLRIKKEKAEVAKREEFNKLKLEDLPFKIKDLRFMKKLIMNLRVAVVEHNWNEVTRNINIVEEKLK